MPTFFTESLIPTSGDLTILPRFPSTGEAVLRSDPPVSSGPRIQTGSVMLATNGQAVVLPVPYTTSLNVVVQGTANAAGVNGFFTVATYGSLTQFQIFYSGALIYGPIQLFWIAAGV